MNKQWLDITPNQLLAVGTPVEVQNKVGKVIKAEMVPASNGGLICLHTIKFTGRKEKTNLYTRWKRINPAKIQACNYSFIKAYV